MTTTFQQQQQSTSTNNICYYHHIKDENDFLESQFIKKESPIPYRAIFMALLMFLFGITLIILGVLSLTNVILQEYYDRSWIILLLGILIWLPGFYHLRIAYFAWRKYDGYSFEDIATDN
jgi:hypothetical protein